MAYSNYNAKKKLIYQVIINMTFLIDDENYIEI